MPSLTGSTYRKRCQHSSLEGWVVVQLRCELEARVCYRCDWVAWCRRCHDFHVLNLHSEPCNGLSQEVSVSKLWHDSQAIKQAIAQSETISS